MDTTRTLLTSLFVAALALPAAAQPYPMVAVPPMPAIRPFRRCRRCPRSPQCRRFPPSLPSLPFPCAGASRPMTAPTTCTTAPAILIEQAKFDRAVDRSRSPDRNEEQPHRRGDVLEGLQPGEARAARRSAHHAQRSDQAVRRQPLDQRRQGARSRSAAGLGPGGLPGVAGR